MTNQTNLYRGVVPTGDDFKNADIVYIPDEELVQSVNMAIVLERPLLVMGPPGCGKTRLASAVAAELNLDLFRWFVKSTSRAVDGLYRIDFVRRLQDATTSDPRAQSIGPYLTFGPLGEALMKPERSVVLIDEIDKADHDFPNDLLRELDEKSFTIEEIDETALTDDDQARGLRREYEKQSSPIIIITSNQERDLPDAFLRRCLFHYIEFPEKDRLCRIVAANTTDLELREGLIDKAVESMLQIRDSESFLKAPSTSELIDWVRILHHWDIQPEEFEAQGRLDEAPHWKMLFKHQADISQLSRAVRTGDDI